MNNHLKIGVTGGIGSGKSTVCKIFEFLKIPVYNADVRAKVLMQDSLRLKKKIQKVFGNEAYDHRGKLNRAYLANAAFNDAAKLILLNAMVHPIVFKDYRRWVAKQVTFPYSIKEAALMFETESYKELDKIIVVTAPINVRLDRIKLRDNVKKPEIMKRISNQITDRERMERADYVIENDGNHSLITQVIKLHHHFLDVVKNNE